ncbi:complex I NDUFA9 subunit family protein [Halomonas sp. G15]|uniref:complex I NDUFA9 subunit family protein n=1 Tax=Halomonas sp. G15 TaxID=2903521 RepID=UPI001E3A9C5E|nr:complex I NDUFA9 subunit family protein [Halomonas sp. G15]MCE0732492.1 complex I NDUFA9 subunit family protein [Halomonas sp. G15]
MQEGPTTVFGGTGFLGRAIVRELVEAGRAVRIAARHPRLPDWREPGDRIESVACDIRDESQVAAALAGSVAAINAVGLYVERRRAGLTFTTIHAEGADRLARLAREASIARLVHVSGIGTSADSPSAYVRARAAGEDAVLEALPKAILLRPSVLFGPDDALLANLARLVRLPLVPLFGRGATRLQPVHVDDVARAAVRLSGSRPVARRLFELGGPEILSYRELVQRVAAQLERHPRLVPLPFLAWRLAAALLSPLPSPPLTRDQVLLMHRDNLADPDAGGFADLGIVPRTLHDSLPRCLPEN